MLMLFCLSADLFCAYIEAATSFFDFLTFPIVSLGIPLVIVIDELADRKFVDKIRSVIILSISWGMGYAEFWALKWVLGD